MTVIAEELYIGKFDDQVGTDKIENRLRKGETFAFPHLIAYRLSKEEVIYNWLGFLKQIAVQYFVMHGAISPEASLFQMPIPDQVWENMRNFLRNLAAMPVWVNLELSESVFGGKQNANYWKSVFMTGKTPQGMQVLAEPVKSLIQYMCNLRQSRTQTTPGIFLTSMQGK